MKVIRFKFKLSHTEKQTVEKQYAPLILHRQSLGEQTRREAATNQMHSQLIRSANIVMLTRLEFLAKIEMKQILPLPVWLR